MLYNPPLIMTIRILTLLLCVPLTACVLFSKMDKVEQDRRSVYKESQSLPDLEIPPDLVAAAEGSALEIPKGRPAPEQAAKTSLPPPQEDSASPGGEAAAPSPQEQVAPSPEAAPSMEEQATPSSVAIADPGPAVGVGESSHVLEVAQTDKAQIWLILREFWIQREQPLELDDEDVGVQQTSWAEQETGLGVRFTLLSEPGAPGTTLLLITAEQARRQGESGWEPQASDPEVGRQLVQELRAFFEKAQMLAKTLSVDESVDDGSSQDYLLIPQDIESGWTAVGDAIRKAGLQIESEDRAASVYTVLSDGQIYQISLSANSKGTEVIVLDESGVWKSDDEYAERILSLLRSAYSS